MSNGAVALAGFVSLFTLMLLRVPVGMAMGLVGHYRVRLSHRPCAGAENWSARPRCAR